MPVIFGKKVSTPVLVAVSVGGAAAVYYAWKQHQASSSSSSSSSPSAIDPVTGLPYSQDNQIDPLTGMSYLAEAQEYGSVQAAENAVAGESSIDYSGAYGYGSPVYGSSGNGGGSSTGTGGGGYASNAAWAQAVEAGLTAIGYSSTDVAAALGRYLGSLSETPDQITIVTAALAEYGPPPVGTYTIIPAPSPPPTPGPPPPTPGPPPPTPGPPPADQTGTVYSNTTGETGQVKTTNGGQTWTYDGAPPGKNVVQDQTGTVHSATTGLSAWVVTTDGGETWVYH